MPDTIEPTKSELTTEATGAVEKTPDAVNVSVDAKDAKAPDADPTPGPDATDAPAKDAVAPEPTPAEPGDLSHDEPAKDDAPAAPEDAAPESPAAPTDADTHATADAAAPSEGVPGDGPTHAGTDTPPVLVSNPADPVTGLPLKAEPSLGGSPVVGGGDGVGRSDAGHVESTPPATAGSSGTAPGQVPLQGGKAPSAAPESSEEQDLAAHPKVKAAVDAIAHVLLAFARFEDAVEVEAHDILTSAPVEGLLSAIRHLAGKTEASVGEDVGKAALEAEKAGHDGIEAAHGLFEKLKG